MFLQQVPERQNRGLIREPIADCPASTPLGAGQLHCRRTADHVDPCKT